MLSLDERFLMNCSLFLNFCFGMEALYPKIKNYLTSKKNNKLQ
tara:strand:- start:5812 stop:5940 length:129 start_codon:yes stop_codon:yes gene_type:complete